MGNKNSSSSHAAVDNSRSTEHTKTKQHDIPDTPFDIVAAIDFGSSASGYAYSSVNDFKQNPLDIYSEQCWNEEKSNTDDTNSNKTATSILLHNFAFEAFGYDAQQKYAELQKKEGYKDYALYDGFKMKLYDCKEKLSSMKITDVSSTQRIPVKALCMFTIRTAVDVVMTKIRQTGKYPSLGKANIRWVLTVPAIWSDEAKLLMRQCAITAGIPEHRLLLSLEPEAASIFCNYLKTERPNDLSEGFTQPQPGTKYAIVDIGGGTTDITIHEKLPNGMLKEVQKSYGEGIGGNAVDKAFMELMRITLSNDVYTILQNDYPIIFLDLKNDVEKIKKNVSDKLGGSIYIPLNMVVINEITKSLGNERCLSGDIIDERLRVDRNTVINLFQPTIESIINALKKALINEQCADVSMILLVGGFANCGLLQEAVRSHFSDKRIRTIVPNEARSAILQGAVLYGHDTKVIHSRVTKYTYGLRLVVPFDDRIHEQSRKVIQGRYQYCCNVFDVIVRQNQPIEREMTISRIYTVTPKHGKHISHLYRSTEDFPLYVDDPSCIKIGQIEMMFSNESSKYKIDVQFLFGETVLKVICTDRISHEYVKICIDLD